MSARRHNRQSHNDPDGAHASTATASRGTLARNPASPPSPVAWPRKVDLFGVGVSVTHCEEAAAVIVEAARKRNAGNRRLPSGSRDRAGQHGQVAGRQDELLRHDHARRPTGPLGDEPSAPHGLADARARGRSDGRRLPPCSGEASAGLSLRKLAGGADGLSRELDVAVSGLQVAGAESPPFRALTPEEDEDTVRRINASGAGILLVGLGCPKQDLFAYEHRGRIRPVQVCVGAVFDFFAGNKKTPPVGCGAAAWNGSFACARSLAACGAGTWLPTRSSCCCWPGQGAPTALITSGFAAHDRGGSD